MTNSFLSLLIETARPVLSSITDRALFSLVFVCFCSFFPLLPFVDNLGVLPLEEVAHLGLARQDHGDQLARDLLLLFLQSQTTARQTSKKKKEERDKVKIVLLYFPPDLKPAKWRCTTSAGAACPAG